MARMVDFETTGYPIGPDELTRRQALLDLAILDTPSEPQFDALVDLGCKTFGVPICHISFLDADRQWFKAIRGSDLREVGREIAFCNHTIAQDDVLVSEDASADPRFSSHPMVAIDEGLRFYAGVPIHTKDGLAVGTFCLLDTRPRQLTAADQAALLGMARIGEALVQQFDDANKRLALAQQVEAHNTIVAVQRRQLDRQSRLMGQAAALAKMGAWERDLRTGAYTWSPGMYRLHEIDECVAIDEQLTLSFYPAGERRRVRKTIEAAKHTNGPYQIDLQIITGKGNRRWMRITSNLECIDGVPVRRYGMMQDITEEKATADRMAHMAERDALTGLYNRSFLRERIDELGREAAGSHALLLLDLDGFKDINDTHGHAAGDECLRRISRRLIRATGRNGLVARIGGDEFAVLLDLRGGRVDARWLAQHIRGVMQAPVRWHGQSFQLSASIGIAYRTANSAIGSEELLRDADLALYDAKAAGKNCEAEYRVELKAEATRRFAIVRDIGRALRRGRLSLYYQPKINLADRTHQGFEALLRWTQEDGTVVAAGAFEPALRDPGLSVEIGNFVLEAALNQAASWRADGLDFHSIAINLGASQFRNPNLGRTMLARCAELDLPASMIEVEVTEDVFMSRAAGHALEICRELKAGGMRIGFDDFGTGFASLTHLREFPVDVLKIDRSFISRLGTDASTTSIVHAVIDLAHNLDLKVVAEGVETEGQAQFLRAVGCEWAQGYLYARPMPAMDVPAYLGARLRLSA